MLSFSKAVNVITQNFNGSYPEYAFCEEKYIYFFKIRQISGNKFK
jgi:hypothetical protein